MTQIKKIPRVDNSHLDPPVVKTNVSKIVIVAFSDEELTVRATGVNPFPIPINPESYSREFKAVYDERRGSGQQGTDPRYKNTAPEKLKLDFILDGTNTIEGYAYADPSKIGVTDQIEALRKTVYEVNGEIHRPNLLKIYWASDLAFPCVMTDLSINFTLFNSEGKPLRAKVSATFAQYMSPTQRERIQRNSSPDLTHYRMVKAGDRLDLMTYKIYKDSQLVMQVAKANRLTSFRNTARGKEIKFPPIDKTET